VNLKVVQMSDDEIIKGLTSMLYGLVTVGMMLLMPLVHKGSKNTTGVLNETISLTEDHFGERRRKRRKTMHWIVPSWRGMGHAFTRSGNN